MKYFRTRPGRIALGLVVASGLLSAKIGFGVLRQKGIELRTRQPAVVRLANTTIAFSGASTNRQYVPIQASLMVTLSTELISNEKTLVVRNKASEAEWTLSVEITGFALPPPGSRTENVGKNAVTYTSWNGSLDVAYQVLDRNGRVHDAGNVSGRYNREFSSQGANNVLTGIRSFGRHSTHKDLPPATQEDVKQALIKDVVVQIASKLGNTTQTVDVKAASGEEHLDRAVEFMSNSLWSRALDELQKSPAFPKAEDEAFRQYDLGLVYEAMSYDSKDAAEQRANIFKAAEYYDKALELNPKEKYFVSTIARARDATARYKALDQMALEDKKKQVATVRQVSDGASTSKGGNRFANPGGKPITVGDVIEMHNGGVDDEQIIEFIQNSPSVDFNPMDKDTILAIAKAKLSPNVQNVLRAKVGAPPLQRAAKKSQ